MTPGSVYFDTNFHFHDGESGEKLFVVLGSDQGVCLVVKTTSQPYGKGIIFGCQPNDRFHNFHLPVNTCYLKKNTWVCLTEFYELKLSELFTKRFGGIVKHVCDLEPSLARAIQDCAMESLDITDKQKMIIQQSIIAANSK